jgi:hypothetical protein
MIPEVICCDGGSACGMVEANALEGEACECASSRLEQWLFD